MQKSTLFSKKDKETRSCCGEGEDRKLLKEQLSREGVIEKAEEEEGGKEEKTIGRVYEGANIAGETPT